ncbi:MAG: hypothetical protein QXM68_04240 [Candidatus Aenigmatarchaeota archaeon]|nr:hypothetical protein [Candidatus Aenigmarchaeota archaeon]
MKKIFLFILILLIIPKVFSWCCTRNCNSLTSYSPCVNAGGDWVRGSCLQGCVGYYVCCPSGQTAYCADQPGQTIHSYCDDYTYSCTDSTGDVYRAGDCVTTSTSICPSGWLRCVRNVGWVCDDTCSSSSGGGSQQPLPLSLQISLNLPIAQNGDVQIITAHATSSSSNVANVQVSITITNPSNQQVYSGSCQTNNQGICTVSYTVNGQLGTWSVRGTATRSGYNQATASVSFTVVQCRNDDGCACYEYCNRQTNTCVDFRSWMRGCNYYDACRGDANCCSQYGSCNPNYCVNAEESICEDANYACHTWFSNCGN